MTRWFRMYTDVLDDPKVQKLPPPLFKTWVNLLCLAGRNDGVLPSIEDIAFALRMDEATCTQQMDELVSRTLLDAGDNLTPHNWAERQFKSDTAENAAERKRKQRAREAKRVTSHDAATDVTEDVTVTRCDSHNEVTPPEQSRTEADTEHNKEEGDVVFDPEHTKVVQDILDHHDDQLDHWKREFLVSIKWRPTLTKAQQDSLNAIQELVSPRFGKDKPMPSVKRGTPAYDAWITYYRRRGPCTFYEKLDVLTVPSEFPPQEKAA